MKKSSSILLACMLVLNLCCFVNVSNAAQPDSYTLECTIRDFDPVNNDHPERKHPDFENERFFDTSTTGAVESRLGSDDTPVYADSGYSVNIITNKDSFYDWYHNTEKNIEIPYDMVFTKSGSMYTFDSTQTDGFFPINNKGFGNYQDNKNYHFTMELHTEFVFEYGQVFELAGDDDLWLFVNDELVGDLGGIHETQYKTISIDSYINSMDLEPGDVCDLDLFFAERHVTESNLKISTNIELFNDYTSDEDEDEDNERPVADASDNRTVRTNGNSASVRLDGSGSWDPDGDRITYKWTDEDGDVLGRDVSPVVELPVGTHVIKLTVSDGHLSDKDNVVIEVVDDDGENREPVADAGRNQDNTTNGEKASVRLDGSGSWDADGDSLTYRWTDEDDRRIATGQRPQVELPVGTHVIKLTVSDGKLSDTDTVVIYVNRDQDGNEEPVAYAGPNKTIRTDKREVEITLDGNGSYDPDGDSLSYRWKDDSGTIIGRGVRPDVLLPLGRNEITLTVSDGKLTDTDKVIYYIEDEDRPGSSSGIDYADLAVMLSAEQTKIAEGNKILFKIDYINKTDEKIPDVEVDFELNDDMEVVEADGGNVSSNSITWDVGDLEKNEKGQIEFVVETATIDKAEVVEDFTAKIDSDYVDLINTYDDTSKLGVMVYSNRYLHKHTRYILGYPDNTFKGERNITRAETAVIFARILELQDLSVRNKNQFIDIDDDFWAKDHIYAAVQQGLFKGVDNNHFNPNVPITRAEFATVIANYLEIEREMKEEPSEYTFNDIKNHWAQGNIEEIARYNIVTGYSDGSFRPEKRISRQEAVTMINRLLYRGPLKDVVNSFPDMKSGHWAFGEVEEAVRSHEYVIDENGEEVMTEIILDPIW